MPWANGVKFLNHRNHLLPRKDIPQLQYLVAKDIAQDFHPNRKARNQDPMLEEIFNLRRWGLKPLRPRDQ
ncbi:hypothetical protein M5D96_010741 [Drosophila gunungcola]|uniref:Uncharacterized protein n=1 Tax=Drosophila gunungcola TaxID=103775 RepID=A0A9P9YGS6_9MUSC|nr:hypothetical protein M5D96_010741 [Drosophila gunungcola]